MVEHAFAGQPCDERAAGEEEAGSALEDIRALFPEPQDLWCDVGGVEVQAGDAADVGGLDAIDPHRLAMWHADRAR